MEIAILDVEMGIRIMNITTYNAKPKDLQFQFIFSNKIKHFWQYIIYNFNAAHPLPLILADFLHTFSSNVKFLIIKDVGIVASDMI